VTLPTTWLTSGVLTGGWYRPDRPAAPRAPSKRLPPSPPERRSECGASNRLLVGMRGILHAIGMASYRGGTTWLAAPGRRRRQGPPCGLRCRGRPRVGHPFGKHAAGGRSARRAPRPPSWGDAGEPAGGSRAAIRGAAAKGRGSNRAAHRVVARRCGRPPPPRKAGDWPPASVRPSRVEEYARRSGIRPRRL
jgi:hypothetical protein